MTRQSSWSSEVTSPGLFERIRDLSSVVEVVKRGGDIVDHYLVVGGVVPHVRIIDMFFPLVQLAWRNPLRDRHDLGAPAGLQCVIQPIIQSNTVTEDKLRVLDGLQV